MKVYIEEISTYDPDLLYDYFSGIVAAEKLTDQLSSLDYVLLKPNLLGLHPPESAVTTHPAVISSLIRVLRDNGIDNIHLGDSPGGTVRTEAVWQITGVKDLADKYGVKLINFGKQGIVEKEVDGFKLRIDSQVLEAPAIINLAKYKTHSLTMFTGAVKNLYGTIPGLIKSDYHKQFPDARELAELIAALYKALQSRIFLNVIDGIWGMEGEGPSNGKARNFGVMLASCSASLLDYQAARMMGFSPETIPLVKLSLEGDNLSAEDLETENKWLDFRFRNTKIAKVSLSSRIVNLMPGFMQELFYKYYYYYPAFNRRCRLCRICVNSCPVQAITLEDKGVTPSIDYEKCIKCMCCHEFCPYKAVYIKKSLLAKLLLK